MEKICQSPVEVSKSMTGQDVGDHEVRWFVMRDLSRSNAKRPAYKMLEELKIDHFTPMVQKLVVHEGRRRPEKVPFIQDLIFVHDCRRNIDPIVNDVRTFQYRFLKQRRPMTVRDADMERFKAAVESDRHPCFYRPEEITPAMLSRRIIIIGGALDSYEGTLVTVRGSRRKRLLVEIPGLIAASVEVEPEYIRLL